MTTPEQIEQEYVPEYKEAEKNLDLYNPRSKLEEYFVQHLENVLAYIGYMSKDYDEDREEFIRVKSIVDKCRCLRMLDSAIKWNEQLIKDFKAFKAKLAAIIIYQLGKSEQGSPKVDCWDGLISFYMHETDIPVVDKEAKKELAEQVQKYLPKHLQEAFRLDFSFRKLQAVVKKLDEKGIQIPELEIQTKTELRMRKINE